MTYGLRGTIDWISASSYKKRLAIASISLPWGTNSLRAITVPALKKLTASKACSKIAIIVHSGLLAWLRLISQQLGGVLEKRVKLSVLIKEMQCA